MAFEWTMEFINEIPINNEEDQWLHDEFLQICQEQMLFIGYQKQPGGGGMGVAALKKHMKDRLRIVHNALLDRGIRSPLENIFNHKTKHNPDKKRGGKKKKGGRRRT